MSVNLTEADLYVNKAPKERIRIKFPKTTQVGLMRAEVRYNNSASETLTGLLETGMLMIEFYFSSLRKLHKIPPDQIEQIDRDIMDFIGLLTFAYVASGPRYNNNCCIILGHTPKRKLDEAHKLKLPDGPFTTYNIPIGLVKYTKKFERDAGLTFTQACCFIVWTGIATISRIEEVYNDQTRYPPHILNFCRNLEKQRLEILEVDEKFVTYKRCEFEPEEKKLWQI